MELCLVNQFAMKWTINHVSHLNKLVSKIYSILVLVAVFVLNKILNQIQSPIDLIMLL